MSAIDRTFETLRRRGETALIPYVTGGYPSLSRSIAAAETLDRNGADLIEIGVPFSDPVADGPTIQQASKIALEGGTNLRKILDALRGIDLDKPSILMSYLNPLLALGKDRLLEQMTEAGLSGLIVPDLPVEESAEWRDAARVRGIDLIQLVAPTTPDERVRQIGAATGGFLYYVNVTGTTGTRQELPDDLENALEQVKQLTNRPVVAGFGISRPEQIRNLQGKADGVVVGSRIVEAIRDEENLAQLIQRLKHATRSEDHAGTDER